MKRIQDMAINWTWFQVKELTARESANMVDAYNHLYKYADIYDAYKRPSEAKVSSWNEWVDWARDVEAKVSIWNEWVDWARDVNTFNDRYEVQNLSVYAPTCQTFNVCAIIREFDEDEIGSHLPVATYIMVVTKSRKCMYLLASDESGEDLDVCW